MTVPTSLLLVSHSLDGHRREYVDLFTGLFAHVGVKAHLIGHWRATLANKNPALFLMIEEAFFGYALSVLIRSLLGRKTAGLLFRGAEAAGGTSSRMALKRWVLKALKRLPCATTLTITPFVAEPGLEAVADGWIYDPQLWDLADNGHAATTPLSDMIVAAAKGRRIVVALGAQNQLKGFDVFCSLWHSQPSLREDYLFVSAGKVTAALLDAAQGFAAQGGMLADRFISQEELLSLYRTADVVWAAYAPDYDQASGIFGRAFQTGRTVAVRQGAQIERLARHLDYPVLSLPADPTTAVKVLKSALLPAATPSGRLAAMREETMGKLSAALGLPLAGPA